MRSRLKPWRPRSPRPPSSEPTLFVDLKRDILQARDLDEAMAVLERVDEVRRAGVLPGDQLLLLVSAVCAAVDRHIEAGR